MLAIEREVAELTKASEWKKLSWEDLFKGRKTKKVFIMFWVLSWWVLNWIEYLHLQCLQDKE